MNEFSVIKTPTGGKILIYGKFRDALAVVDYDGNVMNGALEEEEWIALKNDKDSKFAWNGNYKFENGKLYGLIKPMVTKHARKSAHGNDMHVSANT